ncbi:histidine kinase [Streptomyces sp. HNM0645]|uniref:sensor histidine kinase n=1 Tax=Streptomyces sp. HNM0645 TaxID=2782343 RepID=UPI0024B66BE7|nr:histidine kinase [Streptomyces sp. HNM0645]MDI9888623.1 histidine kinase [Streptomyces sp. HNM0645]
MRRLNVLMMIVATLSVGTLLIAVDARTWWQAAVLSTGVIAAFVASARWTAVGIPRVVRPCLIVTAAVWIVGALVMDAHTAFYGICVVGSLYTPKLPRHRVSAALGLVAFVALVGAARLLIAPEDVTDLLLRYVLIPVGSTVVVTGSMFAGQVFYDLVEELEDAREREAELAVIQERMRFASDLHDIQGHTLHVVKLKITLAEKLLGTDVRRAEEELREVRALIGDTITQTRELAYAKRRLNLSAELENAKNLFEAAGIHVRVEREAEVDWRANELLGQVLRETTTNILRHAQATYVRILLSEGGITVLNDGAGPTPLSGLSGLSTLRERVADNGGELTVEKRDGRFLTRAHFPYGRTET